MALISIKHDIGSPFEGNEYVIDTCRQFEGYEDNDLVIYGTPFSDVPLQLELAVRKNGNIIFRGWDWTRGFNPYFQTDEKALKATPAQIDTVNGLFSRRLRFDGLEIWIGGTIQDICPINVKGEEEKIGKKIYLNK